MLPTAVTLWNYRSFASPVRLELRPVTLIFGDNNSGKSSLLRALPILSDSISTEASGPLEMESPAIRESSFQDLRWKEIKEDQDPNLGIVLHWDNKDGIERIEYRLTWFEEWRRLVIREFSVWAQEDRLLFRAVWQPSREQRAAAALTYEITLPDEASFRSLRFLGLVPARWTEPLDLISGSAAERLSQLQNQVQWLMATRRLPDRIQVLPTAPRLRMKPDGSDAASVLAGIPGLLCEVSSWYEQKLQRRLHVQEVAAERFRLMLQHVDRAALDTDLTDNGEGAIQVLPVLTALAVTCWPGGPKILAIEEPESHLHPSLQRELAEHICDVAAKSPDSRIVLETHSEHLLLGVQLQILKGRLRPKDVQVYWVHQLENGESVADPVTFDENARPQGGWPPGVFADDTEMAREIIQARRERAKT